jgi:hypothetical protein
MDKAKLANYADDTSTYMSDEGIFPFLHALKSETEVVLEWFRVNEMKSNSDKCHLIVAENDHRPSYISNSCIYLDGERELLQSEELVKLLGVWIDNKLTFEEHIKMLLKKGNQKLHALMRVSKYMSTEKLRVLMKTFIESHFNYCPLLWMFHSRKLNNRINRLHERALRVVYKDDNLTFEQLLEKDNSFTIHERNLQKLAILMYKVKHKMCPQPIQEIFIQNTNAQALRSNDGDDLEKWILPKARTVNYGIETLRFRGPVVWNLIPDNIKASKSLESFKCDIVNWKPQGCSCRLCKDYIPNLGYI